MSRPKRTSLSDWWARPDGTAPESEDSDMEVKGERDAVTPKRKEECEHLRDSTPSSRLSPSKRGSPSFYIGDEDSDDHSREASPRKKAAVRISKDGLDSALLSSFMKDGDKTPGKPRTDGASEELAIKLDEMNDKIKKGRCSILENEYKRKSGEMQVRVQAAEERVAELSEELRELKNTNQAAEERMATLSEELRGIKETGCTSRLHSQGDESADIKNVKVAFAAGWEHMNKQLRQIRQQMQLHEERLLSTGLHARTGLGPSASPSSNNDDLSKAADPRWPGRQLPSSTDAPSVNSDNDSDRLSTDSLAASATLDPEERAELKKIRAILAAAGAAYSKDLRQVKSQMQEMHAEMQELRATISELRSCSKGAVEEII